MGRQCIIVMCSVFFLTTLQSSGAVFTAENLRIVPIANGWARNSINAVIFRRNSIITHKKTQYVAFYDENATVVLAKRNLGTDDWEVKKTSYKGNVTDAHNSISIMVDGDGFLHVAWDHHNNPLRYCRGQKPGSLELTEMIPMTGIKENKVTYPEFYRLPDGNLIFIYRDGASGNGNTMINHYETKTKTWSMLQDGFINGQGQRNAYWQATTDTKGTIHISWTWRESVDVATNHDICYARSTDSGKTWYKSTGEKYELPITAASAEYACKIPQRSQLINQTSMCTDSKGRPYIATYWRPQSASVPQYHIVYHDGTRWRTCQVTQRTTPFSLSGHGTKKNPISRPMVLADEDKLFMLFRDSERSNRISLAVCDDLQKNKWHFEDLTSHPVGLWEPTYDTELWTRTNTLHIFVQKVGQGDAETIEDIAPQLVSVLEWRPE